MWPKKKKRPFDNLPSSPFPLPPLPLKAEGAVEAAAQGLGSQGGSHCAREIGHIGGIEWGKKEKNYTENNGSQVSCCLEKRFASMARGKARRNPGVLDWN